MTNTLPVNFPLVGQPIAATFDATDVNSGLGYANYRLFTGSLSGATTFNLGLQDLYSSRVATTDTGADAEINFDTAPFLLPRTVTGTAFVNLGFGITGGGTGNVQLQLHKVDPAGTETALSAQLSGSNIGGSGTTVGMWLLPIPVTQTLIKSGERLRLGVQITGDGADLHEFGHDPQGRAGVFVSGSTVTTKSNLYMPFKIDIGQ
jgi:hypothetical protein